MGYVPVRPALKERKGHEFKDSLGYVVRPWLKKKKKKKKEKESEHSNSGRNGDGRGLPPPSSLCPTHAWNPGSLSHLSLRGVLAAIR